MPLVHHEKVTEAERADGFGCSVCMGTLGEHGCRCSACTKCHVDPMRARVLFPIGIAKCVIHAGSYAALCSGCGGLYPFNPTEPRCDWCKGEQSNE